MRIVLLFMMWSVAGSFGFCGTPLKGTIIDPSGASIANVFVLIHLDSAIWSVVGAFNIKEDVVIRTKQDGTFVVDLQPGFYDVFVSAPAFTPACRKIRMKAGKAQEITLRMGLDPLFAAEHGDRVETVPPKR